jgi:hypothetical protein
MRYLGREYWEEEERKKDGKLKLNALSGPRWRFEAIAVE